MLACYCACIGLIGVYWILVVRLNRRLEGADPESGTTGKYELAGAFADQTDFDQKNFRYVT